MDINTCRTCLRRAITTKSLFALGTICGKTAELYKILLTCANLQISPHDGLPQRVCVSCIQQIERCYSFRYFCEKNEEILMKRLSIVSSAKKRTDCKENTDNADNKTNIYNNLDEDDNSDDLGQVSDDSDYMYTIGAKKSTSTQSTTNTPDKNKNLETKICIKAETTINTFNQTHNIAANSCTNGQVIVNALDKSENISTAIKDEVLFEDEITLLENLYNSPDITEEAVSNIEDKQNINELNYIIQNQYENKSKPNKTQTPQLHESALVKQNNPQAEFPCKICKTVFKFKHTLDLHYDREHSSNNKKIICDICQKKCYNENQYKRHMNYHKTGKEYHCDECGRDFSQSQTYKAHLLSHKGEKPFLCTDCGKTFRQKQDLDVHMRIHLNIFPYTCGVCNKKFRVSGHFSVHKRIHSGEKPFACKYCDKKFSSTGRCKVHTRIHTGEKPYVCTMCDRTFSRSFALKEHLRIHTGEKPYVCLTCGKTFSQGPAMCAHKKTHEKNDSGDC